MWHFRLCPGPAAAGFVGRHNAVTPTLTGPAAPERPAWGDHAWAGRTRERERERERERLGARRRGNSDQHGGRQPAQHGPLASTQDARAWRVDGPRPRASRYRQNV